MEGLSNLSKREIVSLFFLTTKFLSFNIQDNNKQDFRREKRSRIILACWQDCPASQHLLNQREKVLIGTLTLGVRKYVLS